MSDKKHRSDLRTLISKKVKGEDNRKNCEQYFTEINDLIEQVYKYRYKAYTSQDDSETVHCGAIEGSDKKNQSNTIHQEGSEIVDEISFHDACWDALENKDILNKLYTNMSDYMADASDEQIRKQLYRIFSNQLQEMIDKLEPGFRTRKKQIEEITRDSSGIEMVKNGKRKICRLKEPARPAMRPASQESVKKVFETVTDIPRPAIFSKKADAKRAPGINKKEMEDFLKRVLQQAGGAIYYNDLLEQIKKIYVIPIKFTEYNEQAVAPEENNEDTSSSPNPESGLNYTTNFKAVYNEDTILHNFHYETIADTIVTCLSDRLKSIYFHYHVDEKNLKETGEILNLSTASISNNNKKMEKIIKEQLNKNDYSPAEMLYVMKIVSEKISKSER